MGPSRRRKGANERDKTHEKAQRRRRQRCLRGHAEFGQRRPTQRRARRESHKHTRAHFAKRAITSGSGPKDDARRRVAELPPLPWSKAACQTPMPGPLGTSRDVWRRDHAPHEQIARRQRAWPPAKATHPPKRTPRRRQRGTSQAKRGPGIATAMTTKTQRSAAQRRAEHAHALVPRHGPHRIRVCKESTHTAQDVHPAPVPTRPRAQQWAIRLECPKSPINTHPAPSLSTLRRHDAFARARQRATRARTAARARRPPAAHSTTHGRLPGGGGGHAPQRRARRRPASRVEGRPLHPAARSSSFANQVLSVRDAQAAGRPMGGPRPSRQPRRQGAGERCGGGAGPFWRPASRRTEGLRALLVERVGDLGGRSRLLDARRRGGDSLLRSLHEGETKGGGEDISSPSHAAAGGARARASTVAPVFVHGRLD